MKIINAVSFLIICLSAVLAWAHGEDKLGPNGGYIRMPGAFHTEVVPVGTNKMKVFLLDINWKNPSLKDASLQATITQNNKATKLNCVTSVNHYLCTLSAGIDLKSGQLEVLAQREGQKGNVALYKLPLALEKIEDEHGDHGNHH